MHHQSRDAQMMYCSHTSLERHPSRDILLQLTIGTPPVMYGWKTQSLSHETPEGLDKLRVLFFIFWNWICSLSFSFFFKFLSLTGITGALEHHASPPFHDRYTNCICYRKELANTRTRNHHHARAFWQTTIFTLELIVSRCPQGPLAEALPGTFILELRSCSVFMLTLSLAVEGEAFPNRLRKNPARKKTHALGLVMFWNGIFLAKIPAEPSLLIERSRLPTIFSKLLLV